MGLGQFWQLVEATRAFANGRRSEELNCFFAGCFCYVALAVGVRNAVETTGEVSATAGGQEEEEVDPLEDVTGRLGRPHADLVEVGMPGVLQRAVPQSVTHFRVLGSP